MRRQSMTRGRLSLFMGLLGVAFILMTFGYVAWEQRNHLMQRNEDDIRNSAFFLADHAARLLEVTDLTLKETAALVQGESWDEIEVDRPLWEQLRALKATTPYVNNIWLNDPTGTLRLTTIQFPTPPSNVADWEAFRVQVDRDSGLFVGEPILGHVEKLPTFMISRRLQDRGGVFRGVVSVTVALSYLNDYWGKIRLPKGSRITMVRAADARIIAQYPAPPDGLSFVPIAKKAFDHAVLSQSQAGTYSFTKEGEERIGAYHKVGNTPLYIGVTMPENAYRVPWLLQTRLYGAFALIALLALMALTVLASQQFREQADNAALLERQVALRTDELRTETAALETLNRTGNALAGELDIGHIVQNVIDAGVELTGAQIGAFFYRIGKDMPESRGEGDHSELYALSGTSRDAFGDLPSMQSKKLLSPILKEGRVIRSDDILADPDYGQNLPHHGLPEGHPPVRSYMAVPVLARTGEIHGALLFGHERPGVFTERAERLVSGLAGQAAIALENGRLYRDAQREIEERKRAQTQQSLLIRELHHRVKNTLATVQAVVGATARSTSSIDVFYKAFVGRIISLANTHSLLTEAVWQTASLKEILEKELSPYNDDAGERITLDGPAVELPSEAAVPIGMAVHELTTNAAKYGALSVSTGRVMVAWEAQPEADGTRLRLTWTERGGPDVSPPQSHGFGSRLLHRVLTTQLNAQVEMDFAPEGLHVTIDAVLKQGGFLDPVV